MTDDDKALVERLTAAIKESIGKQFNATPIHPDPNVGDWAASGGVIDLKQVAQSLLPIISDRIEELSAENERLKKILRDCDPESMSWLDARDAALGEER